MPQTPFSYTIRRSRRAKRIRLAVHYDGRVMVTLPLRARKQEAEVFLRSKSAWVRSKLQSFASARRQNGYALPGGIGAYRKHKEAARALIRERLPYLNAAYAFSYGVVFIRNQRTLWGSCSKKGNLNFNYRILFLPPGIRDYIIVHELCHLKEFNHSPLFWNLVSRTVPAHKAMRRELKNITKILL